MPWLQQDLWRKKQVVQGRKPTRTGPDTREHKLCALTRAPGLISAGRKQTFALRPSSLKATGRSTPKTGSSTSKPGHLTWDQHSTLQAQHLPWSTAGKTPIYRCPHHLPGRKFEFLCPNQLKYLQTLENRSWVPGADALLVCPAIWGLAATYTCR